MKIILSPTKKMITDTDSIAPVGLPELLDKTTEILSWLQGKSKEELKAIWKCNDKIAEQNFHRLEYMDIYHMLTPAVLSYEGIAFQYMAPGPASGSRQTARSGSRPAAWRGTSTPARHTAGR